MTEAPENQDSKEILVKNFEENCTIGETEDDNIIDEDHEDFIGPKLPRMMSKAEVEEFQRELFAKLDFQLKAKGII